MLLKKLNNAFSALTLLVGWQEGHPAHKNMEGWWRWALVNMDGVAPRRMVSVSASVNLSLHHKVQKFSSGTGSPGWSRKKGSKMVLCVCVCVCVKKLNLTQQNQTRITKPKDTLTQNKQALKSSLVTLYDVWLGNRSGLFLQPQGMLRANGPRICFSNRINKRLPSH